MAVAEVASRVLAFFDERARDLPWRRSRDPYAIWVSEIMLQQTRVATVIPYYERWLRAFPTVGGLAEAPIDEVLAAWSGLGYYSRARNLHRGAAHVVATHGGKLPAKLAELRAIPGVGDYTAGAIASIAFGIQTPLVDGNVIRVLCRLYGLSGDITRTATKKQLWRLAGELVPADRPGDFNQGLMELGSEVCTARSPACGDCNLRERCVALASGLQSKLPVRPPRRKRHDKPALVRHALWTQQRGATLLGQRPAGGLFGGLWEMPQAGSRAELDRWFEGLIEIEDAAPSHRHEQELSHRQLSIDVWRGRVVAARAANLAPPGGYQSLGWYGGEAREKLGLSSATRSILSAMQKRHP